VDILGLCWTSRGCVEHLGAVLDNQELCWTTRYCAGHQGFMLNIEGICWTSRLQTQGPHHRYGASVSGYGRI
jgi:hypothetical protein